MASTLALPIESTGLSEHLSLRRLLRTYSFAPSIALTVVLVIVTIATEPGGFGLTNQLADVAPSAIAALASAPSIIGGGFDLSISPLILFTNAVFVVWLVPHGLGGAISVPIVLAVGLGVGLVTGILIVALRVQPIVATLAMYFILEGVDLAMAPAPVSMSAAQTSGPAGWIQHLAGSVGPIPGGLITIAVPLLVWFALRFVPFRRLLYAVGSNDTTAYSSGVKVNTVRVASYALGGLFAAVGGLALTGLVLSVNATEATSYALPAIAAVVLGGSLLTGGQGGLVGPLFGAFTIYLVQNLVSTFQIDSAYLNIIYPGILLVAVVFTGAVAPVKSGTRWGANALSFGTRRRVVPPTATVTKSRAGRAAGAAGVEAGAAGGLTATTSRRGPAPLRALTAVQARFPVVQLVAVVAVYLYGVITLPGFSSWLAVRAILVLASLAALASGGQTLLILMGGFDLGVSGFIVAGAFAVTVLTIHFGVSISVALVFAVVGAAILGGLSGYICHRFWINPLVITLAMGTMAVGIVLVLNGGVATGNAPPWLTNLTAPVTQTFGLPIPPTVAIWVVVVLLFALFLQRTTAGRHVFATGANARAADYALISTRRVWIATFAFSAVASVLVGVLIGGEVGTATTATGDPYLFQSVVAVIVGGTIFGGPGDYTRTSIGALFLTVLITVLVGHGATQADQYIIYGAIILIALTIYGRQRRLRDRL
jgi:ribose transport system permease protein